MVDPRPTYGYISMSTGLVFSLFGGMLGRQADRLAELATTDALTGLQNARALQEGLQRESLAPFVIDSHGRSY